MKKFFAKLKKGFLAIMGDEKRQNITIPLFAILLSLIAGAIIVAALGKSRSRLITVY